MVIRCPTETMIMSLRGEETPEGAAEYIASMTDQLAKLARRNGLETLSYILEMARLAADRDNEGEDG
jgi:hypothetical protein